MYQEERNSATKTDGDVKQTVYEQVVERDQELCQDCGRPTGPPHHIIPKSMLPGRLKPLRDQPKNLICLCLSCHNQAHTKAARRRHLTFLRETHGYTYDTQPFVGVLGEALR